MDDETNVYAAGVPSDDDDTDVMDVAGSLNDLEERLPLLEVDTVDSITLTAALSQITAIIDRSALNLNSAATYPTRLHTRALTLRGHLLNRVIRRALNAALQEGRDGAHDHAAAHLVPQAKSDWFSATDLAEGLVGFGVAGARVMLNDALNGTGTILMAEGPINGVELWRFDRAVEESMARLAPTWESVILLSAKAAACHIQYAHRLLEAGADDAQVMSAKHRQRAKHWLDNVPSFVNAVEGDKSDFAIEVLLKTCAVSVKFQGHLTIESLRKLSRQRSAPRTDLEFVVSELIDVIDTSENAAESIGSHATSATASLFTELSDAIERTQFSLFIHAIHLAPDMEHVEERLEWLATIREAVRRPTGGDVSVTLSITELADLVDAFAKPSVDEGPGVPEDVGSIRNIFEMWYLTTRFIGLFEAAMPALSSNGEHDEPSVEDYIDRVAAVAYLVYSEDPAARGNHLAACIYLFTGRNHALSEAVMRIAKDSYAASFEGQLETLDNDHSIGTDEWSEALSRFLSEELAKDTSAVQGLLANLYEHYHETAHAVAIDVALEDAVLKLDDKYAFIGLDRAAFLQMRLNIAHIRLSRGDTDATDLWNSSAALLSHLRSLGHVEDPFYAEAFITALYHEAFATSMLAHDASGSPSLETRPISEIIVELEDVRVSFGALSDKVDRQAEACIAQLMLLERENDEPPERAGPSSSAVSVSPARFLLSAKHPTTDEYRLGVRLILERLGSTNWHQDGALGGLIALVHADSERLEPGDALDIVDAAVAATAADDVAGALALLALATPLNLLTLDSAHAVRAQRLLELIACRCSFLLHTDCDLQRYVLTFFLHRADAALNRGASTPLELADRYQLAFVLYLIACSYNYINEIALAAYHCCQLARDYGSFLAALTWAKVTAATLDRGALSDDVDTSRRKNIEFDLSEIFNTARRFANG